MQRITAGAIFLVLLLGLLVHVSRTQTGAAAPADSWVSGFYVGYMSSSYPPSAIDFSSLTHVMVFSVLPRTDGTLDTTLFIDATNGPRVAKEVAQRAHDAGRKAILVVGGAGSAGGFRSATSPQNMSAFVQNLAQTVTAWGFDGVDVDWEPLSSSDHPAILSLIANLRTTVPGILVTADVAWLNANFPLSTSDAAFYAQLSGTVDQMNLMTYGMADNWSGWVVWHSSAVQGEGANHPSSVASTVRALLGAGVPAAKLGIGIGFYGSCWNAPATAPLQSPGASSVVASDNTMGFANIINRYYNAANYRYDATADAPYLTFSSPTGPAGCTFISYEDDTSVNAKAAFARNLGLGGAMIWQLNEGYNPAAADSSSLLHAVGRAFLGGTTPPAVTATSVTASAASTVSGQAATFTATVTSAEGTPGGVVTFLDGSASIGSASLVSGSATFTTAALAAGSHTIKAAYGGNAGYEPSTSAGIGYQVLQAQTATTLNSSRNPSKPTWQVTFEAKVKVLSPGSGTPTGSVGFFDGATLMGSASLSQGTALFKKSGFSKGNHSITAVYRGSSSFKSSTSPALTQTVK